MSERSEVPLLLNRLFRIYALHAVHLIYYNPLLLFSYEHLLKSTAFIRLLEFPFVRGPGVVRPAVGGIRSWPTSGNVKWFDLSAAHIYNTAPLFWVLGGIGAKNRCFRRFLISLFKRAHSTSSSESKVGDLSNEVDVIQWF